MDSLPSELLPIIGSYLDVSSRRRMRLANSRWFNIIQYDDFAVYYTTDQQLDLLLKRLKKYSFPIGLEFIYPMFTITTKIHEELGQLTQLTKLNGLQPPLSIKRKPLPIEQLHPLTNLTNLKEIVDVPDELMHHFPNTTYLSLYTPNSTLDPSYFTRFTNLKKLDLGNFNFNGPLPHLPNLESLNLLWKDDIDSSAFKNLTNLFLECSTVDSQSLATLTKLRILSMQIKGCIDGPAALQFLTALTNLEYFRFSQQNNDDQWHEALNLINSKKFTALDVIGRHDLNNITQLSSSLQVLELDRITPNSYEILREFTALTRLQMFEGHEDLFASITSLPNLRSLKIRVPDQPKNILHVEKLTVLEELSYNYLSFDESISIRHLPWTKLNCRWLFSEKFLEEISHMTALKEIGLSSCINVTDSTILRLTSLTNLGCLHLSWPSDTLTGVTLTLLTSLRTLSLSGPLPKLEFDAESLKQRMTRLYSVNVYKF